MSTYPTDAACAGAPDPEVWKDIPGYEGWYQVSDRGRVRSLPRRPLKGVVLSPDLRSGYLSVGLYRDGQRRAYTVHRLVAEVFHGPAQPGQVCRHLNGDRLDNRPANLAWGSHVENVADTVAHGRHGNGAKTRCNAGHPFSPENTHFINESSGRLHRRCITCARASKAAYTERQRSA